METAELGRVEFAETDVYHFPQGLPAFEHLRGFLLVQRPHLVPLAFLCSVEQPGLRFICVPVELLAPDYDLHLGEHDRELLEWEGETTQRILLAILTLREGEPPSANLLAPVVLNVGRGRGLQVVQSDSPYPVDARLPGGGPR